VYVNQEQNGKTNSLTLKTDEKNIWFTDESLLPSMMGLFDVDLEFSPATNTLPIRRLNLKVGESVVVDVVWVRLDS
jgi:uncharacterized protein